MMNHGRLHPPRPRRSSIRHSTRDDLEAIRAWLLEEESNNVPGNFLCNWSVIERAQADDELLVYVDGHTGIPVGFQLGRLVRPGILQVRNACRHKGIGRKLVERCLAMARKRNECLLYIECKPSTSIPFWERMGFTLLESIDGKNYAYQVLGKPLPLPEQGADVEVSISFYPESRRWESDTQPYVTYSPAGRITTCGSVHLKQRVLFHERVYRSSRDVVIGVQVDGKLLYEDKAKCEQSHVIGVRSCTNGFYLDTIHIGHAEGRR